MKGPSLDAIKRFKSEQELKRKEEEDRKIKEKLAILEHRALQGDRKAKIDLKKIKDAIEKPPTDPKSQGTSSVPNKHLNNNKQSSKSITTHQIACKKPKAPADFDELMKIAKQNATQGPKPIVKPQPPHTAPTPKKAATLHREMMVTNKAEQVRLKTPGPVKSIPNRAPHDSQPPRPSLVTQVSRSSHAHEANRPHAVQQGRLNLSNQPSYPSKPNPGLRNLHPSRATHELHSGQMSRGFHPSQAPRSFHPIQVQRSRHVEEYDYDEDEYESDDFVVDEEDDDIQDEVRNTIRSVFRYDKRRCDMRERELDRQYRAIGRVSTFEDLEREERRASRLAAAEDAKELRSEEERKRQKMAKKAGKTR